MKILDWLTAKKISADQKHTIEELKKLCPIRRDIVGCALYLEVQTDIDLSGRNILDVKPLEALTSLEYLALENNEISTIAPLSSLIKLKELDLQNNQVKTLEPLALISDLKVLNINRNRINDPGLKWIEKLDGLTNLYAWGNGLSDITPIGRLHSLEKLYLGDNRIVNVQPLQSLTKLIRLDLSHNKISNIDSLKPLSSNLKTLVLSGNLLSCIDCDSLRLVLPKTHVVFAG